ncbi:MAG: hypothetical protein MRJ68_05570 [Nitrospira sp.]|nr:hypothetical protein [Nitrospira sp.]
MLYLHPPFHLINGVSLFRDHEQPGQWYFQSAIPLLASALDGNGVSIPQVQLIKFRGSAGNGGFLNFDVHLGLRTNSQEEADVLDEIRRELKKLEGLKDLPRLSPVPLVDGSVKLMLFDVMTGAPPTSGSPGTSPAGGTTPPSRFVLKANHNAKPALFGNNQAAFSVQLAAEGVTILEKALQGDMSPIGIVYALDFLGLRPAYSVRVDVDWNRVQTHLEEHFKVGIPYITQSGIDKIVDKLDEDQVIRIEVDTFVPEDDDTSGLISRRDQAVAEVQDMITETFFKPSLDPMAREDLRDSDINKAARIIQLLHSGGTSENALFSYNKTDLTRIDQKRLNVRMNERTTVKRSIYPQGHLAGLFRVIEEQGLDPERFIIAVDTDDPWFGKRKVTAISRAEFVEDSIRSLNVNLKYGNEAKNVVLDTTTHTTACEWSSILENGAMTWPVTVQYTVNFKGVDGTERPIKLDSPSKMVSIETVEIDPRELYSIVQVPIIALSFPWDRYPQVEVQLQYTDQVNNIKIADIYMLDQNNTTMVWKVFVLNPEHTRYRYKVIYRSADHKDVEMPWEDSEGEQITLRDPYPNKRTLEIVPVLDWAKVDRAFVDVAYKDESNQVFEQASFELSETNKQVQKFMVSLENPNKRIVSYNVTVINKDGSMSQIPTSYTLEKRIYVRGDMKGHRIVMLRPEHVDFLTQQVRDLTIDMRYEDSTNGLSYADTFTFRSSEDRGHFEYDYVDGGTPRFEYRVKTRFSNNLLRETEWTPSNSDELELRVGR